MTWWQHTAAFVVVVHLLAPIRSGQAQSAADTNSPNDLEELHKVHVSPHLVVFDDKRRTTTLTFTNQGDTPLEATVLLQYGFTYWPNTDTALFHPAGRAPEGLWDGYDTVVANPGPNDRYAGRWLTGVPARIHLAPHESKPVLIHIKPPANLPIAEYYVRLVTLSRGAPPKGGKSLDTKERNVLPVMGKGPPLPRDSARIFYRHGPQRMQAVFSIVKAHIDTSRLAEDYGERHSIGRDPLRTLVRLHLTGTAHFEGYWESYYVTPEGDHISLNWKGSHANEIISLQTDGIIRWFSQTSMLTPGHYTHVLRLIPDMSDFPPDSRLPMDTVQVFIPFNIAPR